MGSQARESELTEARRSLAKSARAALSILVGVTAVSGSLFYMLAVFAGRRGCLILLKPELFSFVLSFVLVAAAIALILGAGVRSGAGKMGAWLGLTALTLSIGSTVVREWRPDVSIGLAQARVIGDLRSVISAQTTYASVNGGHYEGRFECLTKPDLCLEGYPANAPIFLGPEITALDHRYRYRWTFSPGRQVRDRSRLHSESSVLSFAYVAEPESEIVGTQSFCADSTGLICYSQPGTAIVVEGGYCLGCGPLQ